MDEASDEDLMLRVARGDERAFRILSRRYAARSYGLARRITANNADAEEIVQEAMLRVWVNAPRWRRMAAFRTWLYRVIVNLCLNRRRRKPFAALDEAGDPADPAPNASERLEKNEVDRAVAAAIAELPERQRAAIVLTYHEDLSNAETAAVLDTTVSSVEALLVRAKRTLRAKLADGRSETEG
jgi:RNA polymerase sigma-70 factor, ECF subfamily